MTVKAEDGPWDEGPALPPGMEPLRYWFEEELTRDEGVMYVAPFLIEAETLGELERIYLQVREFAGDGIGWYFPDFYEEMLFSEEGRKHFSAPYEIVFFGPLGDQARSLLSTISDVKSGGIPVPVQSLERNERRDLPTFDVDAASGGKIERIVGLINSDIAFANARFRNSDGTTRLAGFLDMDAIGNHPENFPGNYLSASEINGYLGRLKNRDYSETQLYLDYQADTYPKPWRARPSPFAGHGTGVLDAAVGGEVLSDDGRTVIVAVQLPRFAVALTHGYHLDHFVRFALSVVAFVAFKTWIANGGRYPQTLVNISVGGHAGRHDGLSGLERRMNSWIRSGLIDGIFLPAGNSYGRSVHAAFKGSEIGFESDALMWRILPDDGTPSFLEIWLPNDADDQVGLHVRMPTGLDRIFRPADLFDGAHYIYRMDGRVAARLIVTNDPARDEKGKDCSRRCIKLMIARTSLRPPIFGNPEPGFIELTGDVEIRLRRGTIKNDDLVDLWVARDDQIFRLPTRARQSYFAPSSPARQRITNSGTLSDVGTGLKTVVCAAHLASNRLPTSYSGRGIPEASAQAERNIKPTASYAADLSEVHRGTLIAGYFSGSTALLSGTSVSAPEVLRGVLISPQQVGLALKEEVATSAATAEASGTEIAVPILPRHHNDTFDWGAGRLGYDHRPLGASGSSNYPQRRTNSV